MSLNSSSYNPLFSNRSYDCYITGPISLIYAAFNIISILLLLPSCVLVLYLGLRRRLSNSSAATSHSDFFTFHVTAMELFCISGCNICCCAVFTGNWYIIIYGHHLISFVWYGETFFHVLTCFERYMAVVLPVTYLSFRGERGIRIRNISAGCVWSLAAVLTAVLHLKHGPYFFMDVFCLLLCLILISFCSLSVLCILIRPKPGDQGGDRERAVKSTQRAFCTITAILAVLVLRCGYNITWFSLYTHPINYTCTPVTIGVLLNLPCSLVSPLLFLHRAVIIPLKNKNKSSG